MKQIAIQFQDDFGRRRNAAVCLNALTDFGVVHGDIVDDEDAAGEHEFGREVVGVNGQWSGVMRGYSQR